MLINIGIILSICNNTINECYYKNIILPGIIDINISLPFDPYSVVSFTKSIEDVVGITTSIEQVASPTKVPVIITTSAEQVVSSTEYIVSYTETTEDFVSITTTTGVVVSSTEYAEPDVSSSQNRNSNNIPLILTGTTLGSLVGIAGVIVLLKRRQRPQITGELPQEQPLVMPRVHRAYQTT